MKKEPGIFLLLAVLCGVVAVMEPASLSRFFGSALWLVILSVGSAYAPLGAALSITREGESS